MVKVDVKDPKWIVKFKKKEQRANRTDDKFEIFRQITGIRDVRDSEIFDLNRFTGHHQTTPIIKTKEMVTDINNYDTAFILAHLNEDQVTRLRKDPNVEYVEEDGRVFASAQTIGWNVTRVKAPEAWVVSPKRGEGLIVAVGDSGCAPNHPDLAGRLAVQQSFLDSDPSPEDKFNQPSPVYHGTHVIGSICMQDNSEGFVGVAPNAKVMNLRFLDQAGSGTFVDWIEFLEFAKNNNAPVINQSIQTGEGTNNQGITDSMVSGYNTKGIMYPCALGNFTVPNSNNAPSNVSVAWGVSNIRESDLNLSPTSNFGPNTDFCLPGNPIQSTMPPNVYQSHDGTSMATPHLSGLCALALAEWNPGSGGSIYNTGNKAKNTVLFAALKLAANKNGKFTTEWDSRFGFGMPEGNKLVNLLKKGCI